MHFVITFFLGLYFFSVLGLKPVISIFRNTFVTGIGRGPKKVRRGRRSAEVRQKRIETQSAVPGQTAPCNAPKAKPWVKGKSRYF